MSSLSPAATLDRIERDLTGNILPFWIERAPNRANGGFYGALTNDLVPDGEAERGSLLTARILWTFAAAYLRWGDPAYRKMADYAYADLLEHFHDGAHGGFWWAIGPTGRVAQDRKQVYAQAFAIYALSEYHAATGLRAPLDQAVTTYRLIEAHAREERYGGYLEAFGPQWEPIADVRLSAVDLNEPKSQNTHLHLLEAYTRLLQIYPDPALRQNLVALTELMLDRILDPHRGHLGLFFALDWSPRSTAISYGHDIEAAWLFTRTADVLQIPALTDRIRSLALTIADVTLTEGVDADGGVFNAGGPGGLTDTNKEWWPQAEAVIGFLNAYQLGGAERHLAAALRSWAFIEQHLIDTQRGEWLRGVTREGAALEQELKISFWKCPYHNGRTGLEAGARLRAIAASRTL